MITYASLKRYLFKLDPETAHSLAHVALRAAGRFPFCINVIKKRNVIINEKLRQYFFGRKFENPVGLAAGFDKDGSLIEAMPALGFGFIEIGTVTQKPQPGNPKPRLFRFPEQESLENAMGFNNRGMFALRKKIGAAYPFELPLGINIGKNRATPQEKAQDDYIRIIDCLKDCCDYFVINVSSPNTPGLRDLQNRPFIRTIFAVAKQITSKPVLLKISPDMEISKMIDICAVAVQNGAAGIIATNTSIDYSLLSCSKRVGGISGKAIREKSFASFNAIARELYGKTVLISSGGIDSAVEAYKSIKAGASLIQIYTALIFHGPSRVKEINLEMLKLLDKDGFHHISEAVGVDRK